jgi:hypothetical protein
MRLGRMGGAHGMFWRNARVTAWGGDFDSDVDISFFSDSRLGDSHIPDRLDSTWGSMNVSLSRWKCIINPPTTLINKHRHTVLAIRLFDVAGNLLCAIQPACFFVHAKPNKNPALRLESFFDEFLKCNHDPNQAALVVRRAAAPHPNAVIVTRVGWMDP